MQFTTDDIIRITGATLAGAPADAAVFSSFLTDSRSLGSPCGTVFCAIRTGASDGHRYIADMVRRGVRAFIVEGVPDPLPAECTFFKVADVPAAIGALGAAARDRFKGPLVAITGSAGKTVVKEMLYSMLLPRLRVHRSPRSWNSRLGVPLTLTEMPPDTEVALVEAGIDSTGDMDAHRAMLRPDIGVLTAITAEHAAGFSSEEEKIREKARLFAGEECRVIFYDPSCPAAGRILREMYPGREITAVGGGSPEGTDRALAAAVAARLGVTDTPADVAAVSSRLDVHEGVNDCLMIFDNFTHDPRSLRQALDFTRRRGKAGRSSTIILGDLLHAPAADPAAVYAGAADMLAEFGISRVVAVGAEVSAHAGAFAGVARVERTAGADDFLARYDINSFSSETILISGDPAAGFRDIRARLENPRHDTIFEINLDSLVHNFNHYRSLLRPGTGLIAMVKASGYGTGAPGIARTLQAQGAAYLAVAVVDEGVELRRSGITMPIMVLNPITTNYKALFDCRLEPSVFSLRELETLRAQAERFGVTDFPVHIKLDTGMHRVGFTPAETDTLAEALLAQDRLRVSTLFSHLATADCLDQDDYTRSQLETFEATTERLAGRLPYPVRRHILNTAGIMRCPRQYQYDFVRLGIGLYGVSPLPGPSPLKTVASLRSTVISLKEWEAGTTIGYGRLGVLSRHSVVATVPIGYADGVNRRLGRGAASFVVRDVKCPTVGNICMDQCMIDVTDVPGVAIGDSVEVFGPANPVEGLAEVLDTIPYELLTAVSPRVKRIYFRE